MIEKKFIFTFVNDIWLDAEVSYFAFQTDFLLLGVAFFVMAEDSIEICSFLNFFHQSYFYFYPCTVVTLKASQLT
jgi:hypothetical protein